MTNFALSHAQITILELNKKAKLRKSPPQCFFVFVFSCLGHWAPSFNSALKSVTGIYLSVCVTHGLVHQHLGAHAGSDFLSWPDAIGLQVRGQRGHADRQRGRDGTRQHLQKQTQIKRSSTKTHFCCIDHLKQHNLILNINREILYHILCPICRVLMSACMDGRLIDMMDGM